jgi:hypothetical protein
MRIAVVGTPRSGNSWVRTVLGAASGLPHFAAHHWRGLPALPADCIVQIHWARTPAFRQFLDAEGFRVVTIAHHPLDVLISALHFARHEPAVAGWLDGGVSFPPALLNAAPASVAFQRFAAGCGGQRLLAVTADWWDAPGVVRLRYESLVADPAGQFAALAPRLDIDMAALRAAAVRVDFAMFRDMANRHGWQGRPGLWQSLIPPMQALWLRWRHRRVFAVLNYHVRLLPLSRRHAIRNWDALQR